MGGGDDSVVLIMERPWAEGVLVTGKGAEGVRVTGYITPGTVSCSRYTFESGYSELKTHEDLLS